MHINGNHYITFILHMGSQTVRFGDPNKNPIPQRVRKAFIWWLQQLLEEQQERSGSADLAAIHVTEHDLPCTPQRDDNSCAILSLNALMHHYAPEMSPLLPSGSKNALVLERMAFAHRVLSMQSHYVS